MTSYSNLSKKELIGLLEKNTLTALNNETQSDKSSDNTLLKNVLDTIDEPIYIVDLMTEEIIFANKKIVELFGSVVGKKCWKVLQKGQSKVCNFCTNKHLLNDKNQPTGIRHSTYLNEMKKKWFQCRDQAMRWNDGRLVAVKTSVDVTALKNTTLSLSQLLEENKKLTQDIVIATDNERRQLSQDLHDEIGQIGTAIKLNADFLVTKINGVLASENEIINDIILLSEQLLNTVRNISTRLNPRSIILDSTVNEMLQSLFSDWIKRNRNVTGQIIFNAEVDFDLPLGIKETLYRVIQEALTNITRHSEATEVKATLSIYKKEQQESTLITQKIVNTLGGGYIVDLIIFDNGCGFPKTLNSRCLGLKYMNERVRSLGGSLFREKSPTGGAQIHVQLPFI
jgi:signal transduction histidine kinase